MNATEDLAPVITVNWEAVEDDLDREIDDERANEIGYLGSNASKRTLESELDERGFEYEELGTLELGALDPTATLYEYEKDGETRYGVEWTERSVIDDYVIRSLIFDDRPDREGVATEVTIEDHRRENPGMERTMSESTARHRYRCDECDENGRWRISESAAANDALDHEHAEHPGALNYKTRVESEEA